MATLLAMARICRCLAAAWPCKPRSTPAHLASNIPATVYIMLYPAKVCYGKLRFFQNVQKISKVPLYKYQYRKKDQENAI